jgi:LPS-assembly protein
MRRLIAFLLFLLLTMGVPAAAAAQGMPLSDCKDFRISSLESGGGDKGGRLAGKVVLLCDATQVFAEELTWDEKKLYGTAVLVIQEGLRVNADRMEMDRATKLGTFFHATGTARIAERAPDRSMFGSLEPEVTFSAEEIEKIGNRSYRLTNGWFTTCLQASPRWEIRGTKGTITLNEHVLLKNALLKVKGVPVLYLPIIYYPLTEDDRSSGFLIPTYSASSVRGHGISNAYFWAIGRAQDATFYHDYFSKSGQGFGGEYRFVSRPGSSGNANFYMLNEQARVSNGVVERTAHRSYDIRGFLNQRVSRQFNLIGRANYFSDSATQQLYQQNPYDYSRRDRYFGTDLTGNFRRARLSVKAEQRDVFLDLTTAQRSGLLPKVNLWMNDRPLGHSKIYVGFGGEVANIKNQRNLDDPTTSRGLWRFDAAPGIRAPLSSLSFLYATTSAAWRFTRWSDSYDPLTNQTTGTPLTRALFEVRADLVGPVFSKVFQTPNNGYAERFKHLIEPRVSYSWISPFVRQARVLVNDSFVDSVPVGNATLTYGLTNRFWARVRQPGINGAIREFLTVGIAQSYYTQESASLLDQEYQTATTGSFSPVRITAASNPTDAVTGTFQMSLDPKTLQMQSYSLAASIMKTRTQISGGWSQQRFLVNVPGSNSYASAAHFVTARAGLRTRDGRYGGNYGFNYDVKNGKFADQRFGAFYNAQCCGVSADYQIADIGHLGLQAQVDRRFNFSVTLAGIGSFSNPMGAFGNNTGVR